MVEAADACLLLSYLIFSRIVAIVSNNTRISEQQRHLFSLTVSRAAGTLDGSFSHADAGLHGNRLRQARNTGPVINGTKA